MKKLLIECASFIVGVFLGLAICILAGMHAVHAQTAGPYQFSVAPGTTVANCAVVASQTSYCWTEAGPYWSNKGAAFAPLVPPIPTKANIPSQTITVPAVSAPLQ